MLSVQRPYSLHCDFGSGLFSVPFELSGRKESGLRYAAKANYRTENYQLARHVLESGLAALQVTLDEIRWNHSRANNSTSCSCIAPNI